MKTKQFSGSWGVFWLWIILFWPIAIVYWASKQVAIEVDVELKSQKTQETPESKRNKKILNKVVLILVIIIGAVIVGGIIYGVITGLIS